MPIKRTLNNTTINSISIKEKIKEVKKNIYKHIIMQEVKQHQTTNYGCYHGEYGTMDMVEEQQEE